MQLNIISILQNACIPSSIRPWKVKNTAKIRNRYNQLTHLIQDPTWESDKIQENTTQNSTFPQGCNDRQDSMTYTKHKQQERSTKESWP